MTQALAAAIQEHCQQNMGIFNVCPGLIVFSCPHPIPRFSSVLDPSICVIAQGHKRLYLGERLHTYDTNNYLINSLTMPLESEICDASQDRPYLGMALSINRNMVNQLMLEMGDQLPPLSAPQSTPSIQACPITERFKDAMVRLLQIAHDPQDLSILGAGVEREIYYEVLKGPQGALLRNCAVADVGANRMAPVIHFIENHYDQNLDVETIAKMANMSTSTLHEYFKQVTALTPIQYIKQLRLHRAHTLILNGHSASSACYSVGYSSPSQFSREFKRFFGSSPRDVAQAPPMLQEARA